MTGHGIGDMGGQGKGKKLTKRKGIAQTKRMKKKEESLCLGGICPIKRRREDRGDNRHGNAEIAIAH